MVKLLVGVRGSGKTKSLIELVNNAAHETRGSVVCIEEGNKLHFDVTYKARLINTEEYAVSDAKSLYGFIAGIAASNNDITDIFVDSALKICGNDMTAFEEFIFRIEKLAEQAGFHFTATVSTPVETFPESMKKFC